MPLAWVLTLILLVALSAAVLTIERLRKRLRAHDINSIDADAAWTQAMDALDYPMYLVDLNDCLVRANTAFYKSSGRKPEDCIGKDIPSLIHFKPEDTPCPGCQARFDRRDAFFTKEADDPSNPTGKPVEVNIKVIRDSFGEPIGIIQSIRDLSHLRDTENRLRERQALLTQAQSMAHMGDWEWQFDSGEWQWSEEALRILNIDPKSKVKSLDQILPRVHAGDRVLVQKTLSDARQEAHEIQIRFRSIDNENKIRHILCRGQVILNVKNKPTKLVGIIQDISDYQTTEDELRRHKHQLTHLVEERTKDLKQALKDAEHANRAKTTFLSNISHELRTPLNAIIGYSQLLVEELESEEQQNDVSRVLTAGNQLLAIINDLLDVTAIEARRTNLAISEFSLIDMVDEVQQTLHLTLTDNNNQFKLTNLLNEQRIEADLNRVRQALLNVVSNAIKFTQDGVISITLKDDAEYNNWVCVEVTDTGIGMADDQIRYIFEAFSQGDGGLNRKYGGTGVGLNLTYRLWNMMGGKIDVQSELGKGSTFRLRIPRHGVEQPYAA